MIAIAEPVSQKNSVPEWAEGFLALLPAIQRYARRLFASLSEDQREECVAEVLAAALVAYVALFEQGRVDLAYPTVLARYAAAQVRKGRRVGSRCHSNDVFARTAQRRYGFAIERVDRFDREGGEWVEATIEDSRTPVADQAAFRIDFPTWLATHTSRDRQIAETLALGHSTAETARLFRVSPGRISQLRRRFDDSWSEFQGDEADREAVATAIA
jgi:hypothetical protein